MYNEGMLFDGRYLLKERKGRGSFGEVWLAEDTEIGVDFAIKIYVAMDQKGLDEFRKEYQLSCNLINSNLLHINKMEVCREDGCPYLVMPYCPRGASSLVGQMSEADMWHFINNIANGLAYLHEQTPPIIHQDIKPDNILQMQSGDFVITDFGISKQLRGTRRSAGGDSSGAVAYMGPERFQRGYTSIKSSDIWSLGATIYEMATGELPFEGKGGKMQSAGFDIPALPTCFSQELDEVMQACMHPEPWSRPSGRELADYAAEKMKGRNVPHNFNIPYPQTAPEPQPEPQPVYEQPAPQAQPAYEAQPAYAAQPQAAGESKSNKNLPVMIGGAAAAVVVIGLLIFLFSGGSGDVPTEPEVAQVEEVQTETTTPAVQPVQEVAPVAAVEDEPEPEPTAPAVETPAPVATASATPASTAAPKPAAETSSEEKAKPEPKPKSGNGTLKLSYGTYTGQTKGGYPNGKGRLTYSTSRQINKYDTKGRMAAAGDYVEGMFVNGFFTTGKHYSADGTELEKISVGVAEGVYESK